LQYQEILLLFNMTMLIIFYFFYREKPKQLKLIFTTTIYAYILATPLPHLLLWIPLKWIVLFYVIEIGLAFIIIYLILCNTADINLNEVKQPAAAEDTADINLNEVKQPAAAEDTADISLNEVKQPAQPAAAEDTADISLNEVKQPAAAEDTADISLNEVKQPAAIDKKQIHENKVVEFGKHNIVEPNNDEQLDIEQLINKAFDAKCKDDYRLAIQLFEQILRQKPPEAMVALIVDDIEVMRKKLS